MKRKIIAALLTGTLLSGVLVACDSQSANSKERDQQASIQDTLMKNQPLPYWTYSEYRQTLIDVESAEAHGVATTSFFFNQGVQDPIFVCPSIGFPIPSTANLSNPQQITWSGNQTGVVSQMDPNGVYTGQSSGTYVECVDPTGIKYAKYWEGFVDTIGGPAHWDGKSEVLDGPPTVVTKK